MFMVLTDQGPEDVPYDADDESQEQSVRRRALEMWRMSCFMGRIDGERICEVEGYSRFLTVGRVRSWLIVPVSRAPLDVMSYSITSPPKIECQEQSAVATEFVAFL